MSIAVRDYVYEHISPYDWDHTFLVWPTDKTQRLWKTCTTLLVKEQEAWWVLDIDTHTISTMLWHGSWYIQKEDELIYWLQTDQPLKRAIKPFGWIRVVKKACEQYGYTIAKEVEDICMSYRKTHNDGVFDVYSPLMRSMRSSGILTWLPDNYARWRIIGDYRRVALYGIDVLINEKQQDKERLYGRVDDERLRLLEEVSMQIDALHDMKAMAATYGFDLSVPATTAKEAIQRTYFAFLAAIKEQDGAAMSLWNVSSFFDIYIERDFAAWNLDEVWAQELIDQFVIKLRLVRQLRAKEYDLLFAGDPTWTTEALAGSFVDGKHKVTKTTYRFLQTLYNLWSSPEPNLTVLWSKHLPDAFKIFCAQISIDTSAIQYENDDLMRPLWDTDDYGIACCVSQMAIWKWMQFFGARCNLAKALLYSINGWVDEISWKQVFTAIDPLQSWTYLIYDEVKASFMQVMDTIAEQYVQMMHAIHYMHDKYYYERAQMALIDTQVKRQMAFWIAWLSVVADSLSAIKTWEVKVERNESWVSTWFTVWAYFPVFGNNIKEVDEIAVWVMTYFSDALKKHPCYRGAEHTLSVLTITSNVVYGKKTWATPDGRDAWAPFAPGANPMHGRDMMWIVASLQSVAKLPYTSARDGISNTVSIARRWLWFDMYEQQENIVRLLDAYFASWWQHLNVNILQKAMLLDAIEHPEKYPTLTIRVSWYAVHFTKLSREQQLEVVSRTFHAE